jgi:LmbE family N-acetylglucosaminyl deacetylase
MGLVPDGYYSTEPTASGVPAPPDRLSAPSQTRRGRLRGRRPGMAAEGHSARLPRSSGGADGVPGGPDSADSTPNGDTVVSARRKPDQPCDRSDCHIPGSPRHTIGMVSSPLTLMTVHAHPDDEATSTGGVLHKYGAEGVRTILVTCTNGELGDGPDGLKPDQPGHDQEEVKRVRRAELETAARALGVAELELLGYRDSGMAEWEWATAPGTFSGSDLATEVDQLRTLIELYRPQVVVTYTEDGGYGHPDHVRAHQVTRAAVEAAGIVSKLYYTAFPKSLARRVLAQMKAAGIDPWELGEVEFDPDNPPFGVPDELITTVVDVTGDMPAKMAAIRAHASQMDNAFFAQLSDQVAPMVLGEEYFIRALDQSRAALPENDLFAGLR